MPTPTGSATATAANRHAPDRAAHGSAGSQRRPTVAAPVEPSPNRVAVPPCSETAQWPADWYVIHTKPRQEALALQHLRNQNYDVWLPTHSAWRKHAGEWARVSSPMFPRYLFARPATSGQSIGPIRSTIGVSNLVRFGNTPARLPDAVAQALQQLERQLAQQPAPETSPFSPGMTVTICDGPLRGLQGIVARSASDRVMVLLELLGREKAVALKPGALA